MTRKKIIRSGQSGPDQPEAHLRNGVPPSSALRRLLAALPIPVFLILVGLFMAKGSEAVFEPPWLLPFLNAVFLMLIPFAIVYITVSGYLSNGSMGLLGLSCGALIIGVTASIAGLLIGGIGGPNKNVTIFNMGALLAGAFHCAGAAVVLTGIEPEFSPRRRRITVVTLYLGIVLFMGVWLVATLKGLTPLFFVQGVGATLIRQIVLGSAIGLFAVSAALVALLYLRSKANFQYWYALALFLIATGLTCVFFQKTVGGPIGWVGRSAQYLGGIYLFAAVLSAVREIHTKGMKLETGISGLFQHRLEKLVQERTQELTSSNDRLKQEINERRRAEQALQEAHDELERCAEQRTSALVQEIEERRKTETALLESHARYKGIFENTRNGIAVYTAVDDGRDFIFTEFNSAGEKIDQVDRKDLIGRRVTEMFLGVKDFGLLEVFQRVWRTGTAESFPLSFYKDGRISGWRENFIYRLSSGEIVALYSDETRRKQAEEALENERTQLLSIFESMPGAVHVVDPQTYEVLFMNRYAKEMFGQDAVGKPCHRLFYYLDSPCPHCDIQTLIARGEGEICERESFSESANRHFLTTARLMQWSDGRKVRFGLSIDITARKQGEVEQKELQAQLNQAQKMESIGVMAGGVAHDFNNILTTIIGNAQLALAELKRDDPVYEDIEEIKKAGDRGASLTRQLLAFSRRETCQPEVLDLNDVVHDMDKLLRRLIRENIELRTVQMPDLWKVRADVGQMEQVIMNLVVNAKDVMPDGGTLTIETANVELDRAYLRAHGVEGATGDYAMLAVTDTGPGMDEAIKARIFEPFFTTKEKGKGTGLGLSTVYGIVKQNQGYIDVTSTPGQGASFRIYLPRYLGEVEEDTTAAEAETPRGLQETILLVEDDPSVLRLVRVILSQGGYRVLATDSPLEAIEMVRREEGPIHLLLTDVVMPQLSGRELANEIENICPNIKVLFMSGYARIARLHQETRGDRLDFIEKPFTPGSLAQKVREALQTKEGTVS